MNNDKHLLFFEGMDLAGKSTVAKEFAETSVLTWEIHNKKLSKINPIFDFTSNLGRQEIYQADVLGHMYIAALIDDLNRFKRDKNIILDSTILLRSMNYYKEHGYERIVEEFEKLAYQYPRPDKFFYLTADIETRKRRLFKRINEFPGLVSSNDMLVVNNPERFIRMDESLKNLSIKYFKSEVIDTSKMDEKEVVYEIKKLCPFETAREK